MERRSSREQATKRSAFGTHFLNGRAAKRAAKADSTMGVSSGNTRLTTTTQGPSLQHIQYYIVQYNPRTHVTHNYILLYHTAVHSPTRFFFPPISPSRSVLCVFPPFLFFSFLSFCVFYLFISIIQCWSFSYLLSALACSF